jgi:hypothetical protein
MAQAVEIAFEAGAQVVQHADFGLVLQVFHNVAADKAGAASDEHFHLLINFRFLSV